MFFFPEEMCDILRHPVYVWERDKKELGFVIFMRKYRNRGQMKDGLKDCTEGLPSKRIN